MTDRLRLPLIWDCATVPAPATWHPIERALDGESSHWGSETTRSGKAQTGSSFSIMFA